MAGLGYNVETNKKLELIVFDGIAAIVRKRWMLCAVAALLTSPCVGIAQTSSPADSDCMTCHEDRSLQGAGGKTVFVDLTAYKKSLHGQLEINCAGCHTDLKAV